MKHKKVLIGGCISVALFVCLTFVCLGRNKKEIDPVLWEHVKSVVDFYPDTGIIKVRQIELSTSWLYIIMPNQGSFWLAAGYNPGNIYPAQILPYKDRFILFYMMNGKELSDKDMCRILNVDSEKELSIYGEDDRREWVYVKDKESDKSFFAQKELYEGYDDYLPFGW